MLLVISWRVLVRCSGQNAAAVPARIRAIGSYQLSAKLELCIVFRAPCCGYVAALDRNQKSELVRYTPR